MTVINDAQAVQKKQWWKSRILWFNAIVAALAALEASFSLLQPHVAGNIYAYGLTLLTMGNAVLRIVTTQGICK